MSGKMYTFYMENLQYLNGFEILLFFVKSVCVCVPILLYIICYNGQQFKNQYFFNFY